MMTGDKKERVTIDVRPGRSSDFIDLVRNEQTTSDPMSQKNLMERMAACKQTRLIVAEMRLNICGHLLYRVQKRFYVVDRLVVRDYHRGLGVGTALLEKMRSVLTSRYPEFHIPVRERDLKSQIWLRNRGLECTRVACDMQSYYLEDNTYWFTGERK